MKRVSEMEFEKYVHSFPGEMKMVNLNVTDPPQVLYHNSTKGKFPQSIVARKVKLSECGETVMDYFISK